MILAIKTDLSESYVGLWLDGAERTHKTWEAGRQLSNELNREIDNLLDSIKTTYDGLTGIIFFEGPGSYTGLRIGASVANAIAYSGDLPIVTSAGHNWVQKGIKKLSRKSEFIPVVPVYGGAVHTTKQRK